MACCHEEVSHPKDLPDIKNVAGISHHYHSECRCGCEGLKQKVADLEYAVMQFQLQLEKITGSSINIHLKEYGSN